MHRFYLEGKIEGDQAAINRTDQLHHLRDVLRLKAGDQITAFDSAGREYICSIAGITRQQALLKVVERKPLRTGQFKLAVACALPKKSGFDDIVDKLTQIGVDNIIPLLTDRVVVKTEEAQGSRLERWRKIARSAAEQSQRNTLPDVSAIQSFKDLLAQAAGYELKLIPTLEGERRSLPDCLTGKPPASAIVLIGPEGDFTTGEVEQAFKTGFQPVTLGDNILRVETAAAAVAAYLKLALNQI
jgi:16S rRNA (uracil1498-N3)-methyltransferase